MGNHIFQVVIVLVGIIQIIIQYKRYVQSKPVKPILVKKTKEQIRKEKLLVELEKLDEVIKEKHEDNR